MKLIVNNEEDMNSDARKKQSKLKDSDAKDADDRNSDQKGKDEFECEPTVPILTLEDDAVAQAEKDSGIEPYNSD